MTGLILALDVKDINKAWSLVQATEPYVDMFKIGLELFHATGTYGYDMISQGTTKPIMLDLKLHDIPITIYRSVISLARLQPKIITVHATGGAFMMECAATAAHDYVTFNKGKKQATIAAVTVLTSNRMNRINAHLKTLSLTRKAVSSYVNTIVCSPLEAYWVKKFYPNVTIISPGIRLPDDYPHDQVRVATPEQAKKNGVDYIVVGRSITEANHPALVAKTIKDMIQ